MFQDLSRNKLPNRSGCQKSLMVIIDKLNYLIEGLRHVGTLLCSLLISTWGPLPWDSENPLPNILQYIDFVRRINYLQVLLWCMFFVNVEFHTCLV